MQLKSSITLAAAAVVALGAAGCSARVSPEPPPNKAVYLALREKLEAGAGGAASSAASTADPTGFATLRGAFRVASGTVEQRPALKVDKDMATCAPGGKPVLDNDVVVGPNGELANVLIYLMTKTPDDPKWIHPSYTSAEAPQLVFDQKNCLFLSHVFAARASQQIKIVNSDPVGHNTNLSPKGGATPFNSNIPPNGGSVLYSPGGEEPSPFPVACSIHPWMKAWMITRKNPYFAVTKADGSFEIANLPSGVDLEFRVWQEKAKGQALESVTLDGAAAKWPKGRYKVKLEDGKDVKLDVTVSADVFK